MKKATDWLDRVFTQAQKHVTFIQQNTESEDWLINVCFYLSSKRKDISFLIAQTLPPLQVAQSFSSTQSSVELGKGSHGLQAGGGVELMTPNHLHTNMTAVSLMYGSVYPACTCCHCDRQSDSLVPVSLLLRVNMSASLHCGLPAARQPSRWCNLLPVKMHSLLLFAKPPPVAPSQTRPRAA